MSREKSSELKNLLLMLRLNANRVFERITVRMPEYLEDFALKRTRKFFPDVFGHQFHQVNLELLAQSESETIVALERFFGKVDDLKWYMDHTEEMPAAVENKLLHDIRELSTLLETLNLYLDAELGSAPDEDIAA